MDVLERIEAHVRRHDLVPPGGEVTCLVSGGADSTCLWHALGALGYRSRAVHVHHGLRGAEADADAEHCATVLGAEIVHVRAAATEAELRELRYGATARFGLRATGHTASDQVETVLYRLVSSGSTRGIRPRRADGVVRPLLPLWREETEAYCRAHGLPVRADSTNADTKRGLIRERLLPLLEELDPRARANLLALAAERPRLPRRARARRSSSSARRAKGRARRSRRRRPRRARLRRAAARGGRQLGPLAARERPAGLVVRSRRPGDRLAGRRRKVQDVLVDAKVPRDERDGWPLVATTGGEVVAVPGLAEAPGWEGAVRATREPS